MASDLPRAFIAAYARSLARQNVDLIEAAATLERVVWCSGGWLSMFRDLTDEQRYDLAAYGVAVLDEAIETPGLHAARMIRAIVGPLLREKKPRAEVLIAAYRAANGRLCASDVEAVVVEEIAAFMARMKK